MRKFKNRTNAIKHTMLSDNGLFITLDGLANMGQEQVMKSLKRTLNQKNIPTTFLSEPVYTHPTSLEITKAIKNRKQDLRKIIEPNMNKHHLVICNHFVMDDMGYLNNYYVASNPNWYWTGYRNHLLCEHSHQKICDLNHVHARNYQEIDWGEQEPKYMYKAYQYEPDLSLFFDAYPYNQKTLNLLNQRSHQHMSFKRFKHLEQSFDIALMQNQRDYMLLDCTKPIQNITKQALHGIDELLHNDGDDFRTPFTINTRLYNSDDELDF